jgi:hypothetical protein
LYINVPIAAAAFILGQRVLPVIPGRRGLPIDIPGVLLVTSGLVALVFGLSEAATSGWWSARTLAALTIGVALLAAFGVVESRVRFPLLPLRIPAERNRGGSYLGIGLAVVAMSGLFLLLTYDFQAVLGYSPARAGIAFLPLSAAVMVSSTTISRALLPKVPPRLLMAPGLTLGALGLALLTGMDVHGSYVDHILPAEILLGLGMGAVFVPAFSTATTGVRAAEAGVASAVANTAQQIGASLGTALLNTVAASATAAYLADRHHTEAAGLVHGYATAAGWAAAILLAAAVIVAVLVNAGRPSGDAVAAS